MKKGFTLIELLIVIALLGTLAVALLAAIDPFEQFRKGNDTGTRNTAQEIFNAAIRYYSLKNEWHSTWTFGNIAQTIDDDEADSYPSVGTDVVIQPLIEAGELKDNFIELAGGTLKKIFITKATTSTTDSHIALCYEPTSKSFQNADANTKFTSTLFVENETGDITIYQPEVDVLDENGVGTCKLNGGDQNCYWCIY